MLQLAESQPGDSVRLRIIIVGAGIAGFAAAVALRRAGHYVKVSSASGCCILFFLLGLELTSNYLYRYMRSQHSHGRLVLAFRLHPMEQKP
jgi:glycine/D-amino acid oxidase-like deaminating enzyme